MRSLDGPLEQATCRRLATRLASLEGPDSEGDSMTILLVGPRKPPPAVMPPEHEQSRSVTNLQVQAVTGHSRGMLACTKHARGR